MYSIMCVYQRKRPAHWRMMEWELHQTGEAGQGQDTHSVIHPFVKQTSKCSFSAKQWVPQNV